MHDPAESDGDLGPSGDETWEEIEQAYQRALQTIDALDAAGAALVADDTPADAAPAAETVPPASAPTATADAASSGPRVTPRQILEAVLFVGGEPLTSRKLCGVLRDEFGPEEIDRLIDELNACYAREERPYEIRLGEGGYRMELRAEFARVRNRAFGLAPREVKLSQDALEVLALVAYRQPITKGQVEESGKESAGSVLNQLLRRELLALERTGHDGKHVAYRTTPRFLQLFGLTSLDELPQADELSFK